MNINPTTYLLSEATHVSSPNYNDYPPQATISLLVIHCISLPEGQYGGDDIISLFTNELDCKSNVDYLDLAGLKVSAHVLIRRDGEAVQFVPFNKRAWHAGKSNYAGQENCNDFSIGIELEGTDKDGFTTEQYRCLAKVTCALQTLYPGITNERIVGHADIAPGRKTDPGVGFDWALYRAALS